VPPLKAKHIIQYLITFPSAILPPVNFLLLPKHVLPDMETIYIVKNTIIGFCYDRIENVPIIFSTIPICVSTYHFKTASRTTPTLLVFVIIGVSKNPDSVTQVVPVISPFQTVPLAYTGLNFLVFLSEKLQ
jgi:hypothetical protein